MADTGGAALAVGIWYQTIGGAVSLIDPWVFEGAQESTHGNVCGFSCEQTGKVLLEYYDMDSAVFRNGSVSLFQFKVSSSPAPDPFSVKEIREILKNATRCILSHQSTSSDPIAKFVLVSNRPKGDHISELETIIRNCLNEDTGEIDLDTFANQTAPAVFWDNSKDDNNTTDPLTTPTNTTKTMRDLAKSITYKMAAETGKSLTERSEACLYALANFSFASVKSDKLVNSLTSWLANWGVLPNENSQYISSILGTLQTFSGQARSSSPIEIMGNVLRIPNPRPLAPGYVWESVISDLRDRVWYDPPTPRLLQNNGILPCMLDKSSLLRGLPYQFFDGFDMEDDYKTVVNPNPRIFALVGPGGTGKTSLLANLLYTIASGPWDWQEGMTRQNPEFIGYPILLESYEGSIDNIGNYLMKWANRPQAFDQPVERCAVAASISSDKSAMWIGFDGLDELPEGELFHFAKSLSSYADSHSGVRILITSREDQFNQVKHILHAKGLMRKLSIEELDASSAREALRLATDNQVELRRPKSLISPTISQSSTILDTGELLDLESSIRQPLFIGIIRQIVENEGDNGIAIIQAACDGDPSALDIIAAKYMRTFCERIWRRCNVATFTKERVFSALKALSTKANDPSAITINDWMTVCNIYTGDQIRWGTLRDICASSGLINLNQDQVTFEWRHRFIGRRLSQMQENKVWS